MITLTHKAVPLRFSNMKLTTNNELPQEVSRVPCKRFIVLYPLLKGKCDGLRFMWQLYLACLCGTRTRTALDAENKGFAARRKVLLDALNIKRNLKFRVSIDFFGFMESLILLK